MNLHVKFMVIWVRFNGVWVSKSESRVLDDEWEKINSK